MLANRDVDQRGLAVAVVRRFGLVGGRLDGFLGAIVRLLLQFLFVFGLVLLRHRQDRDWNASAGGQEPCEVGRELAIRALVHGK